MSNASDQFSWPDQSAPMRHTGSERVAFSDVTAASVAAGRCMDSGDILRGQRSAEINHNGSTYRLQATRLGKLILTK